MMISDLLWSAAACRRFSADPGDTSAPAKLRSLERRARKKSGSKLPHSKIAANSMRDGNSEWRVAAAGGKRPAAARGLLFAAHGGTDQVLDGIGGCVVPFFRKRAAARPTGQRGPGVADGFLVLSPNHPPSCTRQIYTPFALTPPSLPFPRPS